MGDRLRQLLDRFEAEDRANRPRVEVSAGFAPGFRFYYQGLFAGGKAGVLYIPLLSATVQHWADGRTDLLCGRA